MIDKTKITDVIYQVFDTSMDLLKKEGYTPADHAKMKLMRTVAPYVNAGVSMVQQENAAERNALIQKRMEQLGYEIKPKTIEQYKTQNKMQFHSMEFGIILYCIIRYESL